MFFDAGVETVQLTENTAEEAIMRYFMRQSPECGG